MSDSSADLSPVGPALTLARAERRSSTALRAVAGIARRAATALGAAGRAPLGTGGLGALVPVLRNRVRCCVARREGRRMIAGAGTRVRLGSARKVRGMIARLVARVLIIEVAHR